jgi:hypothetical protein
MYFYTIWEFKVTYKIGMNMSFGPTFIHKNVTQTNVVKYNLSRLNIILGHKIIL